MQTREPDLVKFCWGLTALTLVVVNAAHCIMTRSIPLCVVRHQYHIFLGWYVCRTKLARNKFIEAQIFSRKMLQNLPEMFEPLFYGPEKSCKFLPNFPQKKAFQKQKITDELLQERRENISHPHTEDVVTSLRLLI